MGFCTWYDSISEKLGQSWAQTNNISVKKRQHLLAKLEKFLLNIALAVGQPLLLYLLHKTARYTVHKACCLWNDEILSNEIAAFFPACIEKNVQFDHKRRVCAFLRLITALVHTLKKGRVEFNLFFVWWWDAKEEKKKGVFHSIPLFIVCEPRCKLPNKFLLEANHLHFKELIDEKWWWCPRQLQKSLFAHRLLLFRCCILAPRKTWNIFGFGLKWRLMAANKIGKTQYY